MQGRKRWDSRRVQVVAAASCGPCAHSPVPLQSPADACLGAQTARTVIRVFALRPIVEWSVAAISDRGWLSGRRRKLWEHKAHTRPTASWMCVCGGGQCCLPPSLHHPAQLVPAFSGQRAEFAGTVRMDGADLIFHKRAAAGHQCVSQKAPSSCPRTWGPAAGHWWVFGCS